MQVSVARISSPGGDAYWAGDGASWSKQEQGASLSLPGLDCRRQEDLQVVQGGSPSLELVARCLKLFSEMVNSLSCCFPADFPNVKIFRTTWELNRFQHLQTGNNLMGKSSQGLIFTESAHWANSVLELQCPSVCLSVCLRHRMQFFSDSKIT